jgi:hypothetical protein
MKSSLQKKPIEASELQSISARLDALDLKTLLERVEKLESRIK